MVLLARDAMSKLSAPSLTFSTGTGTGTGTDPSTAWFYSVLLGKTLNQGLILLTRTSAGILRYNSVMIAATEVIPNL